MSCKVSPISRQKDTIPVSKNCKKKRQTFGGSKHYFKEYCKKSSIHCFQYFGENRTIWEIIWWILTFVIILGLCGTAIYLIYKKWSQSPVIVSFATKETPIYEIPFPAVTICPTPSISHKCLKYSEVGKKSKRQKLAATESIMFDYLSMICMDNWRYRYFSTNPLMINRHTLIKGKPDFSEEFFKVLEQCNPFTPENFIVKWMGVTRKFQKFFQPIVTEEGICYSFNMFNTRDVYADNVSVHESFNTARYKSEWIPQVGYAKNAGLTTFPSRALLSGALNSLQVTFFHDKRDVDYRCKGSEQGYKIILHLPNRIPRSKQDYFIIPFNRASSFAVYPEMITTSERIKMYSPIKRHCYFHDENYMRYFKQYTRENCHLECLTNITLKRCGCVQYFMPREANTSLCGVGKLMCVRMAEGLHNTAKLVANINHGRENETDIWTNFDLRNVDCGCLPTCTDITYEATVTPLTWDWEEQWDDFDKPQMNQTTTGVTQMNLFIKRNEIVTVERNELYGSTDFLSNFGGLLGLFTGFSVLSLMEVVYFCSIRILGNRRLFGNWYGSDNTN